MAAIEVSQKTKKELLKLKIKENKKSLDEPISEMTLAYKKKKFLEASEKFRKRLEEKLRGYMKAKKIADSTIEVYVRYVKGFHDFLQKEMNHLGVDHSSLKDLQAFFKKHKKDEKEKAVFLYALKSYALATKNRNLESSVNRLLGKGTWLDRLSETLDEHVGEELREKIMVAGGSIKQTSSPNKKAVWAKCMMEYLEANADEETCKKVMSNNLHFKNPKSPSFMKLKKMYRKSDNIDDVLVFLHNKWKKIIGDRYGYDSSEYKFVENDPTIESGNREGNIIYVSKIPFQIKEYLEARDEKTKRFHYCHCGWVRASLQKSEEEQISPNFCYCSGGWHKVPFEAIFDQPLKFEIVKSVLKGDDMCTFAIYIPEDAI